MKRIFYYALAAVAALSIAGCNHSHNHEHEHSHANDEHLSESAHHTHSHVHADGEECDGSHSHDGHSHSHDTNMEAHSHEHKEHSHSHDEHAHSHEGANVVSFPLELQKKIDFAVEKAIASNFDGAVKVAGRVSATPDNVTTVVATAAGRVHYVGNLVEGKGVRVDDALFRIDGGDVTENDAAVKFAAAESEYMFAKADYERKSSLYDNDIVSQKELQAAEAALRQSEAHYKSMQRTFSNGDMVLKSAISGYVATLMVDNGEYVAAGTPLAVLQRQGEVNIEAEVPVRYAKNLRNISSVNIELAGNEVIALDELGGHVVAVGYAANSCNMIPVTVAVKELPVPPGAIVTLHLASSLPQGRLCVAVPRTALVEEMGNYFVFVRQCDDSFEKREVVIGSTDGRYTQILKGVHEGEMVVSKGAVSLKLSQGAAAIDPHAGHVH